MSITFTYSDNDTIIVRCGDEEIEIPLPKRRTVTPPVDLGASPAPAPPPSEPPPWEIPVIGLVGRDPQTNAVALRNLYRDAQRHAGDAIPIEVLRARSGEAFDASMARFIHAYPGLHVLDVQVDRRATGQPFALRSLRDIVDSKDNDIDVVRLIGPSIR